MLHLRVRSEALESDVRQKDKEIESLNQRLEDQAHVYSSSVKSEDKLKVCLSHCMIATCPDRRCLW